MRFPFLVVLPLAVACSSSSSSSSALGTACAASHGSCVLGSDPCANRAPDAAQDCNTNPPNPGGAFCCLDGSSSGGSGSSSGSNPGPADAFVAAQVGPGPQSPASSCPIAGPTEGDFLDVGVATQEKPATVLDGSQGVQVQCTVAPAGGGFDVSLTIAGSGGGIQITSPSGQGAVTTSGGSAITAVLQSPQESYRETDCTIAFTYQGSPVPVSPPVAAGRIWGHVSCPMAVSTTDAGSLQCDAEADFLFEQCSQ